MTQTNNLTAIRTVRFEPTGPSAAGLSDGATEVMHLHTAEALALFLGRASTEQGKTSIPGARRFAAVMKSLWRLSANDNPYADWILLQMSEDLRILREDMAAECARANAVLAEMRAKGLDVSVLAAREPRRLMVVFGSPYGYAVAEAVLEFDTFARLVKTLVRKDRLTDEQGRDRIGAIAKRFRSLFLAPIRWERTLFADALQALTRTDFLPGANEAAQVRVAMAVRQLGVVPDAVLTCAELPRHTRRRDTLSAEQLFALQAPAVVTATKANA